MTISDKNKDIISSIRKASKNKGKIVFIHGIFNIIHPGHLRLFRFAKEYSDFLVVAVSSDKNSPDAMLKDDIRLEAVSGLSIVDFSFILNDDVNEFLRFLKPEIIVKGKEFENVNNPETEILNKYGGKLLFGSGDITFTSIEDFKYSKLINYSSIISPKDFLKNHNIKKENLIKIINNFKELNICVIGDLIVDEYIQCDPLGMSQEDPTIVVTPIISNKFLGGSSIIAAHAASLGCKNVKLISVTGKDEITNFTKEKLQMSGVNFSLFEDGSRPTTLKQRFRVNDKTMLKVSHLRQHQINKDLQEKIFDEFKNISNKLDYLILSDFNYGILTQDLVEKITEECLKRNIGISADSQSSSQIGDISRFYKTNLLTPTEREVRASLNNQQDSLVIVADMLSKKTKTPNIVITLGQDGLLIFKKTDDLKSHTVDRIPALNKSPKDMAGAGDCLLVSSTMVMAQNESIWESVYLGSVAAACQVGRTGNIPLTSTELISELDKQFL